MPALKSELFFYVAMEHGNTEPVGAWGTYINKLSVPIYLRQLSVEICMSMDTIADISVNIWGQSIGGHVDANGIGHPPEEPLDDRLVGHGWDHYSNPTAPSIYTYSLAPDYYPMEPDEPLYCRCGFAPDLPSRTACVLVIGRYTLVLPA